MSTQPGVLAALRITYTDDEAKLFYADGTENTLSRGELARLLAVKRRPPAERPWGKEREVIPVDVSLFSSTQKRAYAEVHGDHAAWQAFGDGPWLNRGYRRSL